MTPTAIDYHGWLSVQPDYQELPPRQRDVLAAILRFIHENGYPPAIKQLCICCGVSSTSTIHHHLTALKKKGLIDWNPAEKRSLTIDGSLLALAQSLKQELLQEDSARPVASNSSGATVSRLPVAPLQIPMMGSIAAGAPLQTIPDMVEHIDVADTFCPPGCYALKVRGYSMVEDHILDGDVVIIDPKATVRDGDVAVALVDGETATLKRIYKDPQGYRLQPANAEMSPIFVKNLVIQGKLQAVLRRVNA